MIPLAEHEKPGMTYIWFALYDDKVKPWAKIAELFVECPKGKIHHWYKEIDEQMMCADNWWGEETKAAMRSDRKRTPGRRG